MRHLNIRIFGEVQGVFFRYSAKEQAERLAIKGFVRNEPDGAVYIEAEGREEALKKFVEWCRKGPHAASVEKIEMTEGSVKNFENFQILIK